MGTYEGRDFSIGELPQVPPPERALEYVRMAMGTAGLLERSLPSAKERAKDVYGADYHAEIDGLHYEHVLFFPRKGSRCAIADLGPGQRDRCWRIEFTEDVCDGIGFDT